MHSSERKRIWGEPLEDRISTNSQSVFIREVESRIEGPMPNGNDKLFEQEMLQSEIYPFDSHGQSLSYIREEFERECQQYSQSVEIYNERKTKLQVEKESQKRINKKSIKKEPGMLFTKTESQGEPFSTHKKKSKKYLESERRKKKVLKTQKKIVKQLVEQFSSIGKIDHLKLYAEKLAQKSSSKNVKNYDTLHKSSSLNHFESKDVKTQKQRKKLTNNKETEELRYEKNSREMHESNSSLFSKMPELRLQRRKHSLLEDDESQLEIPQLLIQQFPVLANEEEIFETAGLLYQKFYKVRTKKIDVKRFKNGYQIHLDQNRIIIWTDDGAFYIGGFREGKGKSGKGYQYKPKNFHFIGYFQNDKRNGYGMKRTLQGEEYIGNWVDHVREGLGKQIDIHGNQYQGQWKNNKFEGKGTLIKTDGSRFEGQFVDGMKHGYGIWKDSSGDIYKGNFENNKKSGYGEYYFSSKKVFKGEFENGFPVQQKKNQDKKLRLIKSCEKMELDIRNLKLRSKMMKSSEKTLSSNCLSHQGKTFMIHHQNDQISKEQKQSKPLLEN